jgi:hypothetical protein
MTPDDRDAFFRMAQKQDSTVVILRDGDSAKVEPITEADFKSDKTVCLWNRQFLPHIERKWVPDPGYFRADTLRKPILEFMMSFTTTWEGKPALGQGRLFGDFDLSLGKPPEFEKWFESLARWIRKNYHKNPASFGGYIGPAAYGFCQNGGVLLPNFVPPRTEKWMAEIGSSRCEN